MLPVERSARWVGDGAASAKPLRTRAASTSDRSGFLAIDVDGTLLDSQHRVLPEVGAAVQHLRRHGVPVALSTARSFRALRPVLDQLGDCDHVICFGGGLTLSMVGEGYVARFPGAEQRLDPIDLVRSLQAIAGYDLATAAYGLEIAYIDREDPRITREFGITGEPFALGSLVALQERPFKLLAISHADNAHELDRVAAALAPEISALRSHRTYLEIVPRGSSKGNALTRLLQDLDISRSEAVAIGDSENDMSMFAAVDHPTAMANATDALKAMAVHVTTSCDEAGVARAIDYFADRLWNVPAPSAMHSDR